MNIATLIMDRLGVSLWSLDPPLRGSRRLKVRVIPVSDGVARRTTTVTWIIQDRGEEVLPLGTSFRGPAEVLAHLGYREDSPEVPPQRPWSPSFV